MKNLRLAVSLFALTASALFTLSCGGASQRQLQSVTLSPATADAQDYPNGQIQFTATGHYDASPTTLTPLSAGWGTCYQNGSAESPTSEITVTQEGIAQCASGAVGTFTVWANDPPNSGSMCNAITVCGGGCFVAGTAQLTCP
jgi:hypothetical protein